MWYGNLATWVAFSGLRWPLRPVQRNVQGPSSKALTREDRCSEPSAPAGTVALFGHRRAGSLQT